MLSSHSWFPYRLWYHSLWEWVRVKHKSHSSQVARLFSFYITYFKCSPLVSFASDLDICLNGFFFNWIFPHLGHFLRGSLVAQLIICLQCGRPGLDGWFGKIPWRREWLPTPMFWPGEFHGQSMGSQRVKLTPQNWALLIHGMPWGLHCSWNSCPNKDPQITATVEKDQLLLQIN